MSRISKTDIENLIKDEENAIRHQHEVIQNKRLEIELREKFIRSLQILLFPAEASADG